MDIGRGRMVAADAGAATPTEPSINTSIKVQRWNTDMVAHFR
jgi:hypothetical protein